MTQPQPGLLRTGLTRGRGRDAAKPGTGPSPALWHWDSPDTPPKKILLGKTPRCSSSSAQREEGTGCGVVLPYKSLSYTSCTDEVVTSYSNQLSNQLHFSSWEGRVGTKKKAFLSVLQLLLKACSFVSKVYPTIGKLNEKHLVLDLCIGTQLLSPTVQQRVRKVKKSLIW